MSKKTLVSVNPLRFLKIKPNRERIIEEAPLNALPQTYAINELSSSLHPKKQYLKIADIQIWDENCKSFTLVPDVSQGTHKLAYFKAGAYLSVFLDNEKWSISRPYSISSSPKEALDGKYVLTIKRVSQGLASNYMLDHWKIGDKVTTTGPLGEFVYMPMRDGKTVIGIAGGSGITPFHSFAKAIVDGDEDFRLILLYGSRREKDILFKNEFAELERKSDKIKIIHVLSDEEIEGYEHGFITANLIRQYAPKDNYSIFLCGPQAMYQFLDQEIKKLDLESKWVRHELQGEIHNPKQLEDYPKDRVVPDTIQMTVSVCDEIHIFTANTEDTILQSLEKHHIAAPAHCRSGECGWCHSLLLDGEVYCPKSVEHRREADNKFGYIHPCCSFPLSDIHIKIPPIQ